MSIASQPDNGASITDAVKCGEFAALAAKREAQRARGEEIGWLTDDEMAQARAAVGAAAPHLIAEGRRIAAAAIRVAAELERQPLIPLRSGNFVRSFELPEWAARLAEGSEAPA